MNYQNKIPASVFYVLDTLIRHGFKAFVAGGAVRDTVLGKEPNDWDIATDALPDQVEEIFSYQSSPTGKEYGTITVRHLGMDIEVTTFRVDGEYADGRRPKAVKFSDSEIVDVTRRDFTINGLLMDINGQVIDHVNGLQDLKNGIIRAIGAPSERFKQDKLRLMRCVRLSARLGFRIETSTKQALWFLAHMVKECAAEANKSELDKILTCNNVAYGIRLMQETSILVQLLPEVACMFKFDQKTPYHMRDLFEHTLLTVECVPADANLRMAALLHDTGKMITQSFGEDGIAHYYHHHSESAIISEKVCERLRYSLDDKAFIRLLVKEHMIHQWDMSNAAIRRYIVRIGEENLQALWNLQFADMVASSPPYDDMVKFFKFQERVKAIIKEAPPLRMKDLAVNGTDLLTLGYKGKEIGEILKALLAHVIEYPENNSKSFLLQSWGNHTIQFVSKELENGKT